MTNPNTAPSAAQPTKESPSPNYRPCKDAAPADYPPLTDEEINAEIARLDENGYLYTDRRPHAFFFAGANFARTQLADRAQRSGVSADPLPRPLLTDLEIQGLRRQARNDPRCADQHWFILMVRAIESYYGVTGAAAQSQPLVEPTDTQMLDWFDGQSESYGFEDEHHGNRWVMDGPFRDLRTALRECMKLPQQHQVKKGEPS